MGTTTKHGGRPVRNIRFDPQDLERIDALAARLPGANRSQVTREALRRGITALERELQREFSSRPSAA